MSWAQEHVMSAYVDATSSFGLKFMIELIGGNRVEITIISHETCFGEKEVRFRRGVPYTGYWNEYHECCRN